MNYALNAIVLYSGNGNFYKLVNVGADGSDGTDPTISTWYWDLYSCSAPNRTPDQFVVTEDQFNAWFPSRNAFYTYAGLISAMGSYPDFAATGSDTVEKQEAAAFMANVNQETGALVYIREINEANWPLYCDSGNTQYPCAAGQQYYGRGPIQLSWNYNYGTAGTALGLDLLANPDLVATDAAVAWKTALWYWMTQKGSASSTPHSTMVNSLGFGETIRAINGGIECNATGLGHAEMTNRVTYYTTFTGDLGVATGSNLTC